MVKKKKEIKKEKKNETRRKCKIKTKEKSGGCPCQPKISKILMGDN